MLDFSVKNSGVNKGETLLDTARNIEAMGVDIMVLRHPAAGAAHLLARTSSAAWSTPATGSTSTRRRALLDLFTIRERKGRIEGLKVAIVGDIAHSRVAPIGLCTACRSSGPR